MVRVWKMHQLYCYVIIRVGMCRYLNWFYLIHKVFGIGFCTNCLLLLCTFSNFLFDSNLLLLVVLLFGIEIEGLYSTMELVQVKTINESHSLFLFKKLHNDPKRRRYHTLLLGANKKFSPFSFVFIALCVRIIKIAIDIDEIFRINTEANIDYMESRTNKCFPRYQRLLSVASAHYKFNFIHLVNN